MNYLRIRLLLSIFKAFYDCRQTTVRETNNRDILKHVRQLQQLKENLIKLSPELTKPQVTTINQDCDEIVISIYRMRGNYCPLSSNRSGASGYWAGGSNFCLEVPLSSRFKGTPTKLV
jgi:hypothetical protein